MTKQRDKKKKLTSLILLLFLTIIMLSTATYAWFTANKTVTVSTLDVHVDAKDGLLISTDGFNWKTIITNADITGAKAGRYGNAINQVPTTLEPVSTAGDVGASGYINMFTGAIGKADDGSGGFTVVTTLATEANGSTGNYIAFDLFLRSEAGGQIYLTPDSNVLKKGVDDKGLKNAARVAFLIMGNTASDSPLATIQGLNGTTANTSVLWEPNVDVHTINGVNAASSVYGITTTTGPGAAAIPYAGAYTAIPAISPVKLELAVDGTYFKDVTPTITTIEGETTYKNAFIIGTGITKIRVYMWIEGQDVDCENNASGSDISFNVQFSATDQP